MNLTDDIGEHFRLVAGQKAALERLGLMTVQDLLMHIPSRYEDIGSAASIVQLQSGMGEGEMVTVYAEMQGLKKKLMWKTKRYAVEAWLQDVTGKMKVRWFNQPYISDSLKYAKYVKVTGKVTGTEASAYFANPTVEVMPSIPSLSECEGLDSSQNAGLYPIYKSSYGITSRWFYYALRKVLEQVDMRYIEDPLPSEILAKYHLPSLNTALVWAHMPESTKDSESARKRFAFEEVFYLQLSAARARARRNEANNYKIVPKPDGDSLNGTIEGFIASYPFTLTSAQQAAIDAIVSNLESGKPMARLLEGDVGSGKTAVAAAVSFAIVDNKLQVAYMAPTEVLAKQLFESFTIYFKDTNVQVGLLTGSGCQKYPSKTDSSKATKISRTQLLKWVKDGSISIVIGTHALIQKSVEFKQLALVIIDEQHRFGTQQRASLVQGDESGKVPHLLSMTATPIPRTLALTIYGDLDLTIIDEMPSGRKKVITKVVGKNKLSDVYAHMRAEIEDGHQVYVICPRISPSDLTTKDEGGPSAQKLMMARLKSVTDEAESLRKVFPSLAIETLHGKLKPAEKDAVMQEFSTGKIDILVATSVVEVGVDVPNATMILIEGAERFGLSQLHQLRGRVLRSSKQAYCYLATTNKTVAEPTRERLKAIVNAKNGFELAELDLKLRGAGELRGDSQWGASDMAMEAIKNLKMVEAARAEAQKMIKDSPTLAKYPTLKTKINSQNKIHLE